MIIINKNIIDEILGRKYKIKQALKKTLEWIGLWGLVWFGVDLVLWLNNFTLDKTNVILKGIIVISLWFYIDNK